MGSRLSTFIMLGAAACCALLPAAAGLLYSPPPAHAGFFDEFGIKDEEMLGKKFSIMVRSQMPLVEDPEIKDYVCSIVDRLSKAVPPQPFDFKTSVLLHKSMNAFAVPGGYVFVHTGLIMQLEHESELAGVIAHELAHVTQRHVASRIDRAKLTTIASVLGALAGAFLGGNAGGAVLTGSFAANQSTMLNYSRLDETEADEIGLQYLVRAGFRPQGMVGSFEKIRRLQWMNGFSLPEYLSTHPDVGSRINDISARVQALPAGARNRPENDAKFLRARTLLWALYGEPESALRHFEEKRIGRGLALMGQAMLAERRRNVTEADRLFNEAMRAAPNDALIHRQAGIFHYATGSPRAEALLAAALRLNPRDGMAQFYEARLMDDAGRHLEAQKRLTSLLKRYPEDAELHQCLGVSLGKSGKPFEGWLHLAYSALYQNNGDKTKVWLKKAQGQAKTPEQKAALDKFEKIRKERKNFGKKDS